MKYYINNLFLILVLTVAALFIGVNNAIIRNEYNLAASILLRHGNNTYQLINNDSDYIGKENIICDESSFKCNGDYITEINLLSTPYDITLMTNEFVGFFNLSSITLNGFMIEKLFFSDYTNFINTNNHNQNYQGVTSVKIINPRLISTPIETSAHLQSVYISFNTTVNYEQPLENISTIVNFSLVDSSAVGGLQGVTYSRGIGVSGTSFSRSIESFSKNLPDFSGFTNIKKFKLDLQNQFDVLSFDRFKNYTGIEEIDISTRDFYSLTDQFYFFGGDNIMNVKKLKLNIGIQRTPQKVSLNNYPLLTDFELITNRQFSSISTNLFQFSYVPPLVSNFKISGSNFTSIESAFSVLSNVTTINLSDNLIGGYLPELHNLNLTKNLDISNNNLIGSIPQSYCTINNVNFSNNSFTGLIPNCFICYMKDNLENNFLGNFFTNKDSANSYCGAIEPSLRIGNGKIYMEGRNLGFDAGNIITSPSLQWEMEIPSTRFSAYYSYTTNQLFSISFKNPGVTLFARAIQNNPVASVVTVYPNYTVIFDGADFSYDKTLISISISTYYCNVISSTFNRIVCIIINAIEASNSNSEIIIIDNSAATTNIIGTDTPTIDDTLVLGKNMKTYLAVKNLAGWQTLGQHLTVDYDPNLQNGTQIRIYACPSECSNHGLCISRTGTCQCEQGYGGLDCSTVVPVLVCPSNDSSLVCSGLGICNTSTGVCSCGANRGGNDCSEIECPVPNCSGFGYCDTTVGKCNCDPSHQGAGCEMPLISCPTSNRAICSGWGTCNNQTGDCTCDVNRVGADCSGIACPISDCSGHGYCDTTVGKCNCDSSHQGAGCEMPLLSCPTSNKAICSGWGTCNNQTGDCTCYGNRAGIDCSGIACPVSDCSGHGYCDTTVGKCNCDSSHQGSGCEMPLLSCPTSNKAICSGWGTCNNQTGDCTCDVNRVGIDCSGIACPISDCSGHGYCDTTVGKCNCDSSHQGSGCEMPLISCPTSNKAICSGWGTCNNQTGDCTCDVNRVGIDCSGIACPISDCSGHGICDTSIGKCNCDSSHQGIGCELNYIACPSGSKNSIECSGFGSCNNVTGVCSCDAGTTYSDCSGILCSVNCLNNGVCNYDIGKCKCTANWKSDDCSTPVHYLSSIDPCKTSGGQVTIYGWFSTQHIGLTVTIGGVECINTTVTENTIVCELAAGSGTKDVNITQNGSSFIGKNKFQYISTVFKCPKDCSNHGTCDSSIGVCTCNSGYSGFDCSSPKPPPSTSSTTASTTTGGEETKNQEIPLSITEINIETGAAAISNQDVNYEISIISLVELDYNGGVVKTNDLKKKWDITIDPSTKNIYQFSQQIGQTGSNITYIIEEVIESSKKYSFAGMNLEIDQGGLKISVSIKNYQYESALNTLQLRFLSSAGESSNIDIEEDNSCNEHEAESDTSNIDPNLTLNYISITKNSKILSGRFINKVVSDGRSTFMSSEIVKDLSSTSTIVVGLNLPHCSNECFIDPDFSVLVSPNFESSCGGNSKSKKTWVIPVAVVVPVVCVSLLTLGAILIYRKHRYSIRLFTMKKSFSVKQRFKLRSFK
ncbi:hypothetical protein ACTFIU_008670 [Dictyostelium citrinum]